jgi:hypothetical protein
MNDRELPHWLSFTLLLLSVAAFKIAVESSYGSAIERAELAEVGSQASEEVSP